MIDKSFFVSKDKGVQSMPNTAVLIVLLYTEVNVQKLPIIFKFTLKCFEYKFEIYLNSDFISKVTVNKKLLQHTNQVKYICQQFDYVRSADRYLVNAHTNR